MTASDNRSLTLWEAYRMRWKRRRLLWRGFRSRRQLQTVNDRTAEIRSDDVLLFATVRNEGERIEGFLQHYRRLGVSHFFIVDNGSDDGTFDYLKSQTDTSLWRTSASYRRARFGLDWLNWLLFKYGHNHWCVTADADEYLDYLGSSEMKLTQLGAILDARQQAAFGAIMLEPYPRGPIGEETSGALSWIDAGPYRSNRQYPLGNLWLQGGVRERVFFADEPSRSPTLNKLPFVKWNRRYCYVNSTHSMLPPRLNFDYDGPGDQRPCGVLIHTKFSPSIVSKSETERGRGQHFTKPEKFEEYYDQIADQPVLWSEQSVEYTGPDQLHKIGLIGPIAKP